MLDIAIIEKQVGEDHAQVENALIVLKKQAELMPVTNREELLFATEALGKVKNWQKEIEERRKSRTKPLKDYIKMIENDYLPMGTMAGEVKIIISNKILSYQAEQERIEREKEAARREQEKQRLAAEQKRLEELAVKANSENVLKQAVKVEERITKLEEPIEVKQTVRTENITTSTRKYWTYEIVDENAVPRAYCRSDAGMIRRAVNSGVREIPGVRIFEETTLSQRSF